MIIYKAEAKQKLREAADSLIRDLVALVSPDLIVLFGSVCRNDAGPDSDVDLFVVKDTRLSLKERTAMLYDGTDRDVDVDMIWYTHAELEGLRQRSSFVRHAMATGEIVYERQRTG
jgi:predicted nucleotidyltransferase